MEDVIKIVAAFLGAIGAVSAAYQWAAMRHRTKIKADFEILEKINSLAVSSNAAMFGDKSNDVARHIVHKLDKQYSGLEPKDRYDVDGSSFFIGLIILCAALFYYQGLLQGRPTYRELRELTSNTLVVSNTSQVADTSTLKKTSSNEPINRLIAELVKPTAGRTPSIDELRLIRKRVPLRLQLMHWEREIQVGFVLLILGACFAFYTAFLRPFRFLFRRQWPVSRWDRFKIIVGCTSKETAIGLIKRKPSSA